MKGKIVIAGGTGYIGRYLAAQLSASGYETVVLTRHGDEAQRWNGRDLGPWTAQLSGAKAIVNLAGFPVAKPWSEPNKLEILESRVESTRVLGKAIAELSYPPEVWLNSSAIGYYGDRGSEVLSESADAGPKGHFLVDVCVAWEDEHERAVTPKTRKVRVRTGVVLGVGSPAFEPMKTAVKFFIGGQFGNGSQYMSWIHIQDLVDMMQWSIENEVAPVLNGTSPEPVTNADMMAMMRAILRRPWAPPVPAFVLKVMSLFGGPNASLLLQGQRAVPQAAMSNGFEFKFPKLRDALADLLVTAGQHKST